MKNYKRSLKNFGKGLKGTALLATSAPLLAIPVTSAVGATFAVKGAKNLSDSLYKNYVENSIMGIKKQKSGDYIISQTLPSIKQLLEATTSDNKMNFLKLQECNMLLQLDSKDENENPIKYTTRTHVGNYKMLKQLAKSGIITSLSKESAGTSSLKIEKMLIGNSTNKNKEKNKEYRQKRKAEIKEKINEQKGILNKIKIWTKEMKNGLGKQTEMYNITFEKTDKILSEEEIKKMLPFIVSENRIDEKKFNIIKDKSGNISQIDYSMKYVLGAFKDRAKQRMKAIKPTIKDELKNLTKDVRKIAKNEKDNNEVILQKGREDLVI